MKGKILRKTTSLALLFSLTLTTVVIPEYAVKAAELFEEETVVVNASSIEEVALEDNIDKEDESEFKSCRLIVFSDDDLIFENAKTVTRYDDKYFVDFRNVDDTKAVYNRLVASGVEVEVDLVNDTPEDVENKDKDERKVADKVIADTNKEKPVKTMEKANEEKDIVVAVLDTGLNVGEDIFNDKVVEGRNFIDEDSVDTSDKDGHGTTMARVILDNANDVKLMPIKVLNDEGKGTTLSAYKGIKYAIEKKVDVINLSMSGIGQSKLLESAINEAYNNGIPVVVSAGNDNADIKDYTPSNIKSAITISSADKVIEDDNNIVYKKAVYSNYGSEESSLDFSTLGHFEYIRTIGNKEVTTKIDGTSVSAAYVTRYIAMLKMMSYEEGLDIDSSSVSYADIYESLRESAVKDLDEKYFGNGYITEENLRFNKSKEEPSTLPSEDISTLEKEEIELNANYAFWNETETFTSFIMVVDDTYFVSPHNVRLNDFGDTMNIFYKMQRATGKPFDGHTVYTGNYNTPQPSSEPLSKIEDANNMTNLFKLFCSDNNAHTIWFSDTLFLTDNVTLNGNNTINYVQLLNTDEKRSNGLTYVLEDSSGTFFSVNSGKTTINNTVLNPSSEKNNDGNYESTVSKTTLYVNNNATCELNGVTVRTTKATGIINNGTLNLNTGCIVAGTTQIENNGIVNQKDFEVGYTRANTTCVVNNGTYNVTGSPARIGFRQNTSSVIWDTAKPKIAVDNRGTFNLRNGIVCGEIGVKNNSGKTSNQSGGTIDSCGKTGVVNEGIYNLSGGYIENTGQGSAGSEHYGVRNESGGIFNHTGGTIKNNYGGRPDATDSTDIGVYQNGTYNLKGSATISNNSVFLAKGKTIKVNESFTGPIVRLTTALNDRVIGRELVSTGAKYNSKFDLAYGVSGTKAHAYSVYNPGTTTFTFDKAFDGNQVGIRPSKGTETSKSLYLSGEYNISYEPNNPAGSTVTPTKFADTKYWWIEKTTVKFSQQYKATGGHNQTGWAKTANANKANYGLKDVEQSNLSGNIKYYAIYDKEVGPGEYTISYDLDGGIDPGNPTTYTKDTPTFTLINPTKPDVRDGNYTITYTFTGWSGTGLVGNKNMTVTISQGSEGDREYTAHWKETRKKDKDPVPPTPGEHQYSITWHHMDGKNDSEKSTTSGTYTHTWWNEYDRYVNSGYWTGEGEDRHYVDTSHWVGAWVDGDTDSHPYPNEAYTGTLHFDEADSTSTYKSSTVADIKTKKKFLGWYAGGYQPGQTFKDLYPEGSRVNLYGRWQKLPTKLPTPTRPEYDFIGWELPDGTVLPPGSSYTLPDDNDVTFTAVWRRNCGQVNYKANGATTNNGSIDFIGPEYRDVLDSDKTRLDSNYQTKSGALFGDEWSNTGYVERKETVSDISNTQNSVYYITNRGDIVNTKGSRTDLYSFQGWSAINYARVNGSSPIMYNGITRFMNIFYDAEAVGTLGLRNKPAGLTLAQISQRIINLRNININAWNRFKKGNWYQPIEDTGIVDMYAIWDKYPVIKTNTFNITSNDLEKITEEDLRKKILVEDEEDGVLKDKSIQLVYDINQWRQLVEQGSCYTSITVIATDSVGNTTKKVIMIGLNQSNAVGRDEQGYIRLISRSAYNKASADGGVIAKSVWVVDEDYKRTINENFDNLENDTPEQKWVFTHDQVLEAQEYIKNNGLGKTNRPNALNEFYDRYRGCMTVNKKGI